MESSHHTTVVCPAQSSNVNNQIPDKTHKGKLIITKNNAKPGDEQTDEAQHLVHYRRTGAMSVTGQLYETKLLTLLLLRFLSNKVEFYLGANITGVGVLDDLCFKYKPANSDKYVIMFLQAKHKVNPDKNRLRIADLQSNDGDFSVQKHFDSYLMIRQNFTPKSKDLLFKGSYHDFHSVFVVYTPLNHDFKTGMKPLDKNDSNDNIKELLNSNASGNIIQLDYKHAEFLTKQLVEKNIRELGKAFSELILPVNGSNSMMDYKLIRKYHVVLAECVLEAVEKTAKGVLYKFQSKFFDNKDRLTTIFREVLYDAAVSNKKLNTTDEDIPSLLSDLDEDASAESLSKIIGNVVTYHQESNKLVFDENSNNVDTLRCIKDIKLEPSIIRNATNIRGKEILKRQKFNIPNEFGNKDLTLKGNAVKIQNRLDFLAENILKLFKNANYSNDTHLVDVDESIFGPGKFARGLVEHDGGLGSALGNLLVYDNDTGALKFNVSSPLPEHANTLWMKLKQEHDENLLVSYRFKFRVDCFPKTSFEDDLYEEYLVKDFIGRYWLCTGQAKQEAVERKAKDEIIKHLKSQKGKKAVLRSKYHAVFLVLHYKIQEWWMLSDEAKYVTQDTHFLEDAMSEVVNDLLLAILHRIYVNKLRSSALEFAEHAVNSLGLDKISHDLVLIVTDSVTHTAVKLLQHYKHSENYTFIDFNYVTRLMYFDLMHEVTNPEVEENTKTQKKELVIACKVIDDMESICKELAEFIQAVPDKKITVIIDTELSLKLKPELVCAYHEVRDDRNGLIDLSLTSQEKVLNECKVVYQGEELVLKYLIGDESKQLITSHILQKLDSKEVIEIGKPLATPGYNNMKQFYVERYLSRRETLQVKNIKSKVEDADDIPSVDFFGAEHQYIKTAAIWGQEVKTLKDLDENIVVVTAPPGMGKSSFLTHLSLETKKVYPNVWIARINLLDHSQQFHKWQHNKTIIDKAETLSFLCKAVANVTREIDFDCTDDGIILKADSINIRDFFQLELFITLCNNADVIFIFDGFDEICPLYEREVIQLIKATATSASTISSKGTMKEPKLWITSRSYNNVKHVIEEEFGLSYSLKPLSVFDQRVYLEKYWTHHMKLDEFTFKQLLNVSVFMNRKIQLYIRHQLNTKHIKPIHFLLRMVFITAARYFQDQINKKALPFVIKPFRTSWHPDTNFETLSASHVDETLNGSPLHTHIAAEYLWSEIQGNMSDRRDGELDWDLGLSTFFLYKRLLETKLTKIRFEEKNCIDVCKPDCKFIHDRERAEFIDMHRKLGLYALFRDEVEKIMSTDELIRVKCMIDDVKYASEKNGVIDCIVYDMPRFVHRTFAEYFAADYICEGLKRAYASQQLDKQKTIWNFIVTTVLMHDSLGVSEIFDYTLVNDDAFRISANDDQTTMLVFECLMKQAINTESGSMTAIDIAVRSDLKSTTMYLLQCFDKHLQRDDFEFFMNLVKNNNLLMLTMTNQYHYCAELLYKIVSSSRD